MAMKRFFATLISAVALLIASEASAQVDFGGAVLNNDMLGWGDMYNLTFTSHNYGTARSMAMGNAFTALGADLVSATLNPAGIGMYTRADLSITPMLHLTKSDMKGSEPYYANTSKGEQEFSDSTTSIAFANFGTVYPIYRGSGAVTNINVGVVYNRIADFNHSYMGLSPNRAFTNSMANIFCTLSNIDNLSTNSDGTMSYGNDPYYWGAVLAYKNGLTNKDSEGWYIDRIAETASIDQSLAVEVSGAIDEYDLSVGFNFVDKLYVGATLGLQSVEYRRDTFYGETYNYTTPPSGADMPYQLDYMNYMQRTEFSGSGVNIKLGITARPVEWLRVGIAYHSPTLYSLNMHYDGEMWSRTYSVGSNPDDYDVDSQGYMYDEAYTGVWEDAGPYTWDFSSPSRLLLGGAVTLRQRVILSVDYERSWYNSIRLQSSPIKGLSYTAMMKDVFKGGDTLRIGAEGYLLPFLALRAGYIWSGSTLRDTYKDAILTHPVLTSSSYVSCGVGLKFNENYYLDLAYQYNTANYSSFMSFYAVDEADAAQSIESSSFGLNTTRHIAVVTLGYRF